MTVRAHSSTRRGLPGRRACNGRTLRAHFRKTTSCATLRSDKNPVLDIVRAIAPGGIRTPDRRIRSPMLYPAELPARCNAALSYGGLGSRPADRVPEAKSVASA